MSRAWKYFACTNSSYPIVKVEANRLYVPYGYVDGPFKTFTEAKQAYLKYLQEEIDKVDTRKQQLTHHLENMKSFSLQQVVIEPDCY